ncbi:MAG TPA: 1-deoxy-D-xylulose-5-phosphate reductoisomerase [Hyphomicrobiales bacterium]|nr:1-deoxy-D-xylulose-5-phosphate reductoisomerase [Hyphomicrobiales bacterium]
MATEAKPRSRPRRQAEAAPRVVSLLGATGSVGRSTVDLLAAAPGRYRVEAVIGGHDVATLAATALALDAAIAVIADDAGYAELRSALAGSATEAAAGSAAVAEAASRPADWTMAGITGAAGVAPTLAAVRRGGIIAIANKECLVCAGAAFMAEVAAAGATVLPVDSEHNAIFQALTAGARGDVERIILTASGGPFRQWSRAQMEAARPADALKHPTWKMGPKITIDSATLMNKGLELIEAHHLFGVGPDRLDVLVHPQSIVHGLVRWRDGSVVAGLATADMRVPIAHCLGWPERVAARAEALDLAKVGTLTFEAPDPERFPALRVALAALAAGGGAPTVLNAANEVAVAAFLAGRIGFLDIAAAVEATVEAADRAGLLATPESVDQALELDRAGRALAARHLPNGHGRAS